MPTHRTGLLIIRAWVEDESAEPLRAHVRLTGDISHGIEHTLTLVRADAVRDTVGAWLRGILDAAEAEAHAE